MQSGAPQCCLQRCVFRLWLCPDFNWSYCHYFVDWEEPGPSQGSQLSHQSAELDWMCLFDQLNEMKMWFSKLYLRDAHSYRRQQMASVLLNSEDESKLVKYYVCIDTMGAENSQFLIGRQFTFTEQVFVCSSCEWMCQF